MELIRGCFINLNDAVQEKCTAYWGALTFIKLPHIIQHLACHYASSNNYLPGNIFVNFTSHKMIVKKEVSY